MYHLSQKDPFEGVSGDSCPDALLRASKRAMLSAIDAVKDDLPKGVAPSDIRHAVLRVKKQYSHIGNEPTSGVDPMIQLGAMLQTADGQQGGPLANAKSAVEAYLKVFKLASVLHGHNCAEEIAQTGMRMFSELRQVIQDSRGYAPRGAVASN